MFLLYNTWTHKLLHLHKSGALRIFAYSLLRFRRMQTKLDQESVSLEDIYIVSCLQGVELCLLCKSISWARESGGETLSISSGSVTPRVTPSIAVRSESTPTPTTPPPPAAAAPPRQPETGDRHHHDRNGGAGRDRLEHWITSAAFRGITPGGDCGRGWVSPLAVTSNKDDRWIN